MPGDGMRKTRVKLGAGLVLVLLVATGSCRDQAAPDDPSGPLPPGIVSNPVTPTIPPAVSGAAANLAAVLAPGVAYVSFRPGTFPGGVDATIR